jgi:phage tail-like protein
MRSWRGHGKGRQPGQPNLSFSGGPGQGGGRAAGQPRLDHEGGAGHGGGRLGGQPRVEGAGGPGHGGGRAGGQPRLGAANDFGGSSTRYSGVSQPPNQEHRAFSSYKATSGEMSPRVADPEGSFVFALEIEGIEVAQFRECSGIKSTTQVFEIEEGGMNHRVHKLPGQSRWDNIRLKYGTTSDLTLLAWRNEVLQDAFAQRRNGSVVMKTLRMEEVRRFEFVQGWPVSWEGPSFVADSAELAIETLEIAHNGVHVS